MLATLNSIGINRPSTSQRPEDGETPMTIAYLHKLLIKQDPLPVKAKNSLHQKAAAAPHSVFNAHSSNKAAATSSKDTDTCRSCT